MIVDKVHFILTKESKVDTITRFLNVNSFQASVLSQVKSLNKYVFANANDKTLSHLSPLFSKTSLKQNC